MKDHIHFLVLGDWGRKGMHAQIPIAQQMCNTAQSNPIDFILSTGDNFYQDGVTSTEDPHWQESFLDIYQGTALQKDWYVILGNHDYHGNPSAQVSYHKINKKWYLPNRYYTFVKEINPSTSVRFICIDTTPMIDDHRLHSYKHSDILEQDNTAQLRWLEETLRNSTEDWKIVMGHHPVYSAGTNRGDQAELIQHIKPLLEQYNVQLYLAGHSHNAQYLRASSGTVAYMVAGAGALADDIIGPHEHLQFGSNQPNFATMYLDESQLRIEWIDQHGACIFQTTIGVNATL